MRNNGYESCQLHRFLLHEVPGVDSLAVFIPEAPMANGNSCGQCEKLKSRLLCNHFCSFWDILLDLGKYAKQQWDQATIK